MQFFSRDNLEDARAYIGSMGWFSDTEEGILTQVKHYTPEDRLIGVTSGVWPFETEAVRYRFFVTFEEKEALIFGPEEREKAIPYIGMKGWFAGSRENLTTIIGQPDNRSILRAVRKEGEPFQNRAGWKWNYFSPDITMETKIYSGVDAEDATPWIGKDGWVGDTLLDIKNKRTKGSLQDILPPDCGLRFVCNDSAWAFFKTITEEEYRACRSLEELKSIMGRKIMRETANGTVIKTIDEVSIVNGKCYINKSTALNLFLHWVFEDNGKPVGVKE